MIRLKVSSNFVYHAYLSIGAHNVSSKFCGGKFQDFLKTDLGLDKLPYGISLIDLLILDKKTYDLFVKLPKQLFETWDSYPSYPKSEQVLDLKISSAEHFDEEITIYDANQNEFLHPYDTTLRNDFVNQFISDEIKDIPIFEHSRGYSIQYRPCEFYLEYWRGYILIDTFVDCKFIDHYLSKVEATAKFKEAFIRNNNLWVSKYKKSFSILAKLRTAIGYSINTQKKDYYLKLKEYFQLDEKDLFKILSELLEIHKNWILKKKKNGTTDLDKALLQLQYDIYIIYCWLQDLGVATDSIFSRYTYPNRYEQNWSQLCDVIPLRSIKYKNEFLFFSKIYLDESKIRNFLKNQNIELPSIYSELYKLQTFNSWIVSFTTLHESIQNKTNLVSFNDEITINALMTMTIRTEIILKEYVEKKIGSFINDLKDVFKILSDLNNSKILKEISNKYPSTRLDERPVSLFQKINSLNQIKNWKKNDFEILKYMLKFITSRNYFAHHYYLDKEIGFSSSELAREILESSLITLVVIIVFNENIEKIPSP